MIEDGSVFVFMHWRYCGLSSRLGSTLICDELIRDEKMIMRTTMTRSFTLMPTNSVIGSQHYLHCCIPEEVTDHTWTQHESRKI
jgi:hypothetical protein